MDDSPRNGREPFRVPPLDEAAMAAAAERQAQLAKPPGSLGQLEEISIRFAGMTGRVYNRALRRRLLVFAADNGVTVEGVSSAPPSVTRMQALNLARGLTGAATLARHFGSDLCVYDVGVDAPQALGDGVIDRRVARGTGNIATGAAMSREQAMQAIRVGCDAASQAAEEGVEILGVGEMGIGNTTTAAALLSALLGLPARETVGRGGGVSDAGLARKLEVVELAVARALGRDVRQKAERTGDPGESEDVSSDGKTDPANSAILPATEADADLCAEDAHCDAGFPPEGDVDALSLLAELGGLDIAAMCGAFLGAAMHRLPVVIDGYICAVAALCAQRLLPGCRDYMFASHASWERGYAHAIGALQLKPMLSLEMRLGEGSGCPPAFAIIDAALVVLREMATFTEAEIDDGYLSEIRADGRLQR